MPIPVSLVKVRTTTVFPGHSPFPSRAPTQAWLALLAGLSPAVPSLLTLDIAPETCEDKYISKANEILGNRGL